MERPVPSSTQELILRCIQGGDASAWQEFTERLKSPITKAVLRTAGTYGCTNRSTIDDLIQETYLKLCSNDFRILRNFDHRHPESFPGFLHVVASNTARDYFRSLYATRYGAKLTESLSAEREPTAAAGSDGSVAAIERDLLLSQIAELLQTCVTGPDKDRNIRIFWLYYRTGLAARAISEMPGMDLSAKGIESLIHRITRDLKAHMEPPAPPPAPKNTSSRKGIPPSGTFLREEANA